MGNWETRQQFASSILTEEPTLALSDNYYLEKVITSKKKKPRQCCL
jgi:hypothetical protein